MKNANFCHFWAIFCPFLPIFAFFAIFSCLNTVLHVFAKFYGLLIIISQFLMGCAKMHTPPRNRVISDAPRNRVKDSQSKAILRGFNIAFFLLLLYLGILWYGIGLHFSHYFSHDHFPTVFSHDSSHLL